MTTDVKILAALPANVPGLERMDVRLLVNGATIKYAYVLKESFPGRWYEEDKASTVSFPLLSTGDWTKVWIGRNALTGLPFVSKYENKPSQLRCVSDVWHKTRIEYVDLKKTAAIRGGWGGRHRKEDRMSLVKHPLFDRPALMKIAEVPSHVGFVERETEAYKAVEGAGIAPAFLGHVAEGGRVVGFLTEWIEGARKARSGDKAACLAALGELHARGVAHKDTHQGNFLLKDGRVYIVDFEYARVRPRRGDFARDVGFVESWTAEQDRSQLDVLEGGASDDEPGGYDSEGYAGDVEREEGEDEEGEEEEGEEEEGEDEEGEDEEGEKEEDDDEDEAGNEYYEECYSEDDWGEEHYGEDYYSEDYYGEADW